MTETGPTTNRPIKTSAARTAAYRKRGRNIGVVLTDAGAIAALDALIAKHGGVTAAIAAAVIAAAPQMPSHRGRMTLREAERLTALWCAGQPIDDLPQWRAAMQVLAREIANVSIHARSLMSGRPAGGDAVTDNTGIERHLRREENQ